MPRLIRDWRAPVILLALALFAYAGQGPRSFLYDDQFAVRDNPVVNGHLPLSAVWTHDFWGQQRVRTVGTYRPVTELSLAIDWRLGHGRPWVFRLTSILCHLLVVLAVFLVWRRLIGDGAAFMATALVAVLAAPSEAVLNSVGRADVFCALWSTVGLWAHRRRGWAGTLGATLCFALALGSKESGAIAPLAWLALDGLLPGSKAPLKSSLSRILAYAVPVGPYLFGRKVAMGALYVPWSNNPLFNPLLTASPLHRILGAARVFATPYVAGILDPWRRLYDCSAQACGPAGPGDAIAWLGLALLIGLFAAPWMLRRTAAGAAAGLAWCALFFLPASNLLVLSPTIYGERLLYVPAIGLAVAIAVGMEHLAKRGVSGTLMAAVGGAVLLANIAAVRRQQRVWNDARALMISGLQAAPRSAVVQANAAVDAMVHRNYPAAEAAARRSIALFPGYILSHRELAGALFAEGRLDEAGAEFERAYALGRDSTLINDYGNYLGRRGEYAKGLAVVDDYMRAWGTSTPELVKLREKLRWHMDHPARQSVDSPHR